MQFHSCLQAGQWLKSVGLGSKGRRPSGAVLHSLREPGVRRSSSDFMDMLRRLINCRIIIIIIIIVIIMGSVYRSNRGTAFPIHLFRQL